MREFVEGFVINAVTHTLISPAHAQTIFVIGVIDTSIKIMVTTSAAVKHLLADVLLGRFVWARRARQINCCSITA